MKPRFEEHEGKLFRMLEEPVPLTPDAEMPCLVRLIQDDSPMGRYNLDAAYFDVIGKLFVAQKIKENPFYSNTLHAYEKNSLNQDYCIASIHTLEIIGYPVAEGSKEWAVQRMKLGDKVTKRHLSHTYWQYDARPHLKCISEYNCGTLQIMVSPEIWLTTAEPTGWEIYKEPKPEPAKEPEIVANKQHANCLVCGKEIDGLLDGHATVSIKRYSISSLYESTYSYYCGKCFLELGFDATERELRNRQQPIAEPEPAKEQFEVGDWVEFIDAGGRKSQGKYLSNTSGNAILVLDITCNMKVVVHTTKIIRKLFPREVIIHIGCLSGTIRYCLSFDNDGAKHDAIKIFNSNGKSIAAIHLEALDTETRELVESLLKAMREEEK